MNNLENKQVEKEEVKQRKRDEIEAENDIKKNARQYDRNKKN